MLEKGDDSAVHLFVEGGAAVHLFVEGGAIEALAFTAPFSDAALKALPPARLLFFRPEAETMLKAGAT